jgi:hypothetical protein
MPFDSTIPGLELMVCLVVDLHATDVGRTPVGDRREVTFDGVATSPHWSGEWPARGIDHIVVGSDGTSRLDVHTVVGSGAEVIAYRGTGRAGPDGIVEGVVFETACERFAWMNSAVGVGVGRVSDGTLTVEIFQIVT